MVLPTKRKPRLEVLAEPSDSGVAAGILRQLPGILNRRANEGPQISIEAAELCCTVRNACVGDGTTSGDCGRYQGFQQPVLRLP